MANSKVQQEGGQFPNKQECITGELNYVEQEASSEQKDNLKLNGQNEVAKKSNNMENKEGTHDNEAKSQENFRAKLL